MRLAETDYTFTEGGANHEIEVVATATLTEMPAPSLDIDGGSILPIFDHHCNARDSGSD